MFTDAEICWLRHQKEQTARYPTTKHAWLIDVALYDMPLAYVGYNKKINDEVIRKKYLRRKKMGQEYK